MGIRGVHAIIKKIEDEYFIVPIEGGDDSGCYLNGNLITN